MVHVATPKPNLGSAIGQGLGSGIGQGLEQYADRNLIARDMERFRNKAQNASPTDLAFLVAEATALNPALARGMGPLYQTLINARTNEASANVPTRSGSVSSQGNAPSQNVQQQIVPPLSGGRIGSEGNFGPSPEASKFFPTNVGPKEAPGNLPQATTEGIVKPILSGDELISEAQQLLGRWHKAGLVNKTLEDAFNIVNTQNEGNKAYNQSVENDRINRIAEQESFGNVAEEALTNVLPDATDEQKAIFRKKGEDFAGQGKSQAEIKRAVAKEATKFKNVISNIERGLSAPRIQNKLQRKLSGNEKSIDQAQQDARIQIQPLLKDGLYDTSRNLLAGAGFYPEEREDTIFGKIKPEVKKTINDIPKPTFEKTEVVGKPGSPAFGIKLKGEKIYTPESKEALKENIRSVWGNQKSNETYNLLQNRKAYEDKGYDWRVYKDSLNELFEEGLIDLSDDQMNQFNSYLDEPPLTTLESILQSLNLRGR